MNENIIKAGGDSSQDSAVQATNFLGLNTVANPQTLPVGATPDTLNTVYTVGGGVQSRPGTGIVARIESSTTTERELDTHEYRTSLGYNYVIAVRDQDIVINDVTWDGSTQQIVGATQALSSPPVTRRMIKLGVFATSPRQVSYVELGLGRVLMLTGDNTPIELRFNELVYTVPAGGETDPTFDISSLPGWHHAQGGRTGASAINQLSTDCMVYLNGTYVEAGVSSTNLDTLVVSGTFNEGDKIEVVRAIWGWWSESRVWFGDQLFQTTRRFRVSDADRTVQIPDRLLDGLIQYPNTTYGMPMIVGYGTVLSVAGRSGNFTYGNTPTSGFYYPSGGGQQAKDFAEASAGTVAGTGVTSVTFAALHTAGQFDEDTTQNSVQTTFSRVRDMQFTAGVLSSGQTSGASVLRDQVLIRKRLGKSSQDKTLTMDIEGVDTLDAYHGIALEIPGFDPVIRRGSNFAFNAITFHQWPSGTLNSTVIRRGIRPEAQILAINLINNYVGVGAIKDNTQYTQDGFVIPAIGVSDFINQGQGLFPSCGSLFQNRLFLGGGSQDPLRIHASAPTDVYLAGEQYLYFQADVYNDADTAPLDFNLQNTRQSDFVARMEAAFGSLFCFGRDGVWRILPSLNTQLSCGFGLSALRAQAFGDGRMFFASEDGVFELVQSEGLSDTYVPRELSQSIRNVFDSFTANQIDYDEVNNRLFVYDKANTIYVYFPETGGWSRWQFALPQTLTLAAMNPVTTRQNEPHFMYWFSSTALGNTRYYGVAQLPFPVVVDYLGQVIVVAGAWGSGNLLLGDLRTAPDKTTQNETVTYLEDNTPRIPLLTEAQDSLTIGGTATTLGTESTFSPDSVDPATWGYLSNSIIRHRQTTSFTDYRLLSKFPSQVYGQFYEYEAFEIIPGLSAEWRQVGLSNANTDTWVPVATIDEEQIGWAYPSYWVSGKFNMGYLTQYKRVTHVSIAYDNTFINPTQSEYCIHDVPTGAWVDGESTGRQLVNAHVFTTFQDGTTQCGYEDVYNNALSEIGGADHRYGQQTLVKLPIQGVGYDFQFGVFNYAPQAWHMTAFQLDGMMKRNRFNGV